MKTLRNASRMGRLSFLSEQAKHDIHQAVREILGTVGMQVHREGARAMLFEAVCAPAAEDRVLVPRDHLAYDEGYPGCGPTGSLEGMVMVDQFIASDRRLLCGGEVDAETLAGGGLDLAAGADKLAAAFAAAGGEDS